MDSAILYVAAMLGDLLIHPLRYGMLSFWGVIVLIGIGFCIQFFGVSWLKIFAIHLVPAILCVLLAVFAELIWNGVLYIPGLDSGFMPGSRMLGFAMCFLSIPIFFGILLGALCAFLKKQKQV